MNEIRLYLGTRDTMSEVELKDIPTNMQEALWMDDPEEHVDFHTGAGSMGREDKRQAVFHGHGLKQAEEKTNILRYFQKIDRGLKDLFEEQSILMVLAGVDYLLPIYHKANTYQRLLEKGLEGNPEELSEKELHKLAWNLFEPIFKEEQKRMLEQFKQMHGQQNDRASDDLKTVVKAANFGQFETLFVPFGVQRWGRYDAQQNKVIIEKKPTLENEDLLDFAAIHTLFNSGKVYVVQPDKLPGDGKLAAILRYAV